MQVVLVKAFLGRFVVVRGHQQAGICAQIRRNAGQLHCLRRSIRAGACDDGHTAADLRDHALDDRAVLVDSKGSGLACRTHCDNTVGARVDMPLQQGIQRFPVQGAIGMHGRDQCHQTAAYH